MNPGRAAVPAVRPPVVRAAVSISVNALTSRSGTMPAETCALKLKVLSDISGVISKAFDLEDCLNEALRILSETLSMKRATVTIYDRDAKRLSILASHGLTQDEKQRGVYRLGEGVTGKIFETAQAYVIPDIRTEPLFLDRTGARRIEKNRITFVGVPILSPNGPLGVLNVDRLFEDDVSFEEDLEFLRVVAALIAQFISLSERYQDLRRENASLKYRISKETDGNYIVGKSPAMQEVQRQIEKVAPTKATVLLLGESGTGKTLIGRIIHELSDRKRFPFIKVNCAAIPENLLESELFGYEKGAFTGAVGSKPGKFEEADRGAIFLDEIGELSLGIQAKLLRVLQEKEFERLGGNRTIKVDVRILAATNKDLAVLCDEGKFRADLYYRINVFPIQTPPLRDRPEDVEILLLHFLRKVSKEYGRDLHFTPDALHLLKSHHWPGNVREMENLVERLVIMADADEIGERLIRPHLPEPERQDREDREGEAVMESRLPVMPGSPSLRDIEKNELLGALSRNDWIQHRAARELGITPRQMGYKIGKYGLEAYVAAQKAKRKKR